MQVTVQAHGIREVVGKFNRMRVLLQPTVREAQRATAFQYREAVVRHASGRPGPEKVTGSYVDHIEVVELKQDRTSSVVAVQSLDPRTRRLEYGFVGVDSLGRHYSQPPYPHWRPAMDEIDPAGEINSRLGRMFREA